MRNKGGAGQGREPSVPVRLRRDDEMSADLGSADDTLVVLANAPQASSETYVIRDDLAGAVGTALEALGLEPQPGPIHMERPARPEHGDWSTNIALVCAKAAGRACAASSVGTMRTGCAAASRR